MQKKNTNPDQFDDLDCCVICMDSKRSVVNNPCGHLVCCKDCGVLQKECPICRTKVIDTIVVYYS